MDKYSILRSASSPGRYQDMITNLAAKYPLLANAPPWPWKPPGEHASPSRLVFYDFSCHSPGREDSTPRHVMVNDTTQLRALIQDESLDTLLQNKSLNSDDKHPRRLLFMLEGQQKEFVAALGETLELDPRYWTCFEAMLPDSTTQARGQLGPILPRIVQNTECFQLDYRQLMHLNLVTQQSLMRCAENERAIGSYRIMSQESSLQRGAGRYYDGVGAVHRKVAFWSQKLPNGGWFGGFPIQG